MTDEQINKQAAKYLGLEGTETHWYCEHCKEEVSPYRVTYQERHEVCDHFVVIKGGTPDFCTDANAVRLLLEKVNENDDHRPSVQCLLDRELKRDGLEHIDALLLPPRTVTIAVLKGVGLWEGEG